MIDFIVVAVLVVIVAAAAFYVYKAKKSGKKCIDARTAAPVVPRKIVPTAAAVRVTTDM